MKQSESAADVLYGWRQVARGPVENNQAGDRLRNTSLDFLSDLSKVSRNSGIQKKNPRKMTLENPFLLKSAKSSF